MKQSKRAAFCGVSAALGIVIQLLGSWTGVGTYISPMLAGLLLIPVGREWGMKYQLLLWGSISLLSLFLLTDLEESLMFLCFFGWYPILRPRLEKLSGAVRWAAKLAVFNAVVLPLEALLMLVLIPESMKWEFVLVLLVLGNAVFVCYDVLVPRVEAVYLKRLRPLLFK